jgi:hypothetical protein
MSLFLIRRGSIARITRDTLINVENYGRNEQVRNAFSRAGRLPKLHLPADEIDNVAVSHRPHQEAIESETSSHMAAGSAGTRGIWQTSNGARVSNSFSSPIEQQRLVVASLLVSSFRQGTSRSRSRIAREIDECARGAAREERSTRCRSR